MFALNANRLILSTVSLGPEPATCFLNRLAAPVFFVLMLLWLSACNLLGRTTEDQQDWSANKFYSEASQKLTEGNFSGAVKLYETLESRYPYGRIAQQAQLETAYAHYKNDEQASAILL